MAAGSGGCLEDSYMATSPWALNAWDAWLVMFTSSGIVYVVSFSINFYIEKVWCPFPGSGSGSSFVYLGILSGSRILPQPQDMPLLSPAAALSTMIHSRAHCRMNFCPAMSMPTSVTDPFP
jgi:hypothetical protein